MPLPCAKTQSFCRKFVGMSRERRRSGWCEGWRARHPPHPPPPFLNRTMRWLCICFYWTYTVYNSCVPSEIVYFPCEWYTIMLVLCSVCELENAFTRMHWYAQYPLFHATRIERMRHTHRYVCYGMVLMVGRMVGWTEDFFFALFLTLYLRDEEWGTNRQSALKLVMRRRWYRMIER